MRIKVEFPYLHESLVTGVTTGGPVVNKSAVLGAVSFTTVRKNADFNLITDGSAG